MAMHLPLRLCYSFLIALLTCHVAFGATPERIEAAVERAARTHLDDLVTTAGLRESSVDLSVLPRETVNPCNADARIEAIDTRSVTRMRFAATCDDPEWRTEFIVRAAITAKVVTAARDMRAGEVLVADALKLESRELAAPADALADPALVEGMSSRRALRRGQLIDRRWLLEPLLVARGATVTIVARNVGVTVQVAGEALAAGRRNEIVQVRNKANGRVIRARVIGGNEVEPVISTDSAGGR
jgi:flagella basal body P-ring formation protein FlgA